MVTLRFVFAVKTFRPVSRFFATVQDLQTGVLLFGLRAPFVKLHATKKIRLVYGVVRFVLWSVGAGVARLFLAEDSTF